MPTMAKPNRDFSGIRVDDLASLNDADFLEVVNADLKRNANRSPKRIDPAVSQALRSERYARRWLDALVRMLASVDGQLVARSFDYETHRAELNKQLVAARSVLDRSPTDPVARHRVDELRQRLYELQSSHGETAGRTARFRNVLTATLHEALMILGERAPQDALLVHERDMYAERVRQLEAGIRLHREVVRADLEPDESADDIDTELWALLRD